MRIVVPISRFDMHLIPDWIEVIKHHKTIGLQHTLHFILPTTIASVALDAETELNGYFQSIETHQLDFEPYGGWPAAPNEFFWNACKIMGQNPASPWLLNEVDCLPIRPNTYDAISSQYLNVGTPFLGHVGPVPWRDGQTGKIVLSPFGKDDVMMSGCGIYPGNIASRPEFKGLLEDFKKGDSSSDEPWDIHLRAAMRNAGMGHTDLIASLWNTGNYRVEGGGIICDSMPTHEIFEKNPTWEHRECGGSVHPSVTLIHGCKDSSLKNLILNNEIPDALAFTRVVPAAGQKPQTQPTRVEALESKVDKLTEALTRFLEASAERAASPKTAPPIVSPAASGATSEGKDTGGKHTTAPGSVEQTGNPISKAKSLLAVKNYRLKELSEAVGVNESVLSHMMEKEGYEISGPAKWVKLKTLSEAVTA